VTTLESRSPTTNSERPTPPFPSRSPRGDVEITADRAQRGEPDRRLVREIRLDVAEAIAISAKPYSCLGHLSEADLAQNDALVRRLVAESLSRRAPRSLQGSIEIDPAMEELVVTAVLDQLYGLGNLQRYIDDPSVENIDVNGCDRVFLTYADGTRELVGPAAESDEELIALLQRAAARFGLSERRFDPGQPELDLRLPDGSRLSAVMAVTARPVVDIRRHRLSEHCLEDLVDREMLDPELAWFLSCAVRARRNIVISGAMNAGKTTLLRALAAEIGPEERIVTIEQALELGLDEQVERHPDCVAMETRLANSEGVGAVGLAQLVRRSLRMNATRVIVGEVLGDEVVPMLNAMSQGRSGSMATIHSDSSAGVFRRLAAYAVQAPERLPLEATNLLVAGAIHLVVHVEFDATRHVVSVREVVGVEGTTVVSNEIWRPDADGYARPGAPCSDATRRALSRFGYPQGQSGASRCW
jgi:pilus assembly protein CpaF